MVLKHEKDTKRLLQQERGEKCEGKAVVPELIQKKRRQPEVHTQNL